MPSKPTLERWLVAVVTAVLLASGSKTVFTRKLTDAVPVGGTICAFWVAFSAAGVLATVRSGSGDWTREQEEAFKAPIRAQYDTQGHPYYASARLWDDGIIDPADSRRVLGLALSAALNKPLEDTRFGVFRM